jgi:hypothetical protein
MKLGAIVGEVGRSAEWALAPLNDLEACFVGEERLHGVPVNIHYRRK